MRKSVSHISLPAFPTYPTHPILLAPTPPRQFIPLRHPDRRSKLTQILPQPLPPVLFDLDGQMQRRIPLQLVLQIYIALVVLEDVVQDGGRGVDDAVIWNNMIVARFGM